MAWLPWIAFVVLVLLLLALDLGILNRRPHVITAREALLWTLFWVFLSFVFNGLIYFMYEHHWLGIGQIVGHPLSGKVAAIEFFTACTVERSLSVDNLFVMAVVFSYFGVPAELQHRVLFWGILGALILRGIMIGLGLGFVEMFWWSNYVFGGILLFTAVKMSFPEKEEIDPDKNPFVKLVRRAYPVTSGFRGPKFFVRENGRRMATPLFLSLVIIETSDVVFAVDSIPAVFGVTRDPFIVFTSNIFAILGLRSLYFVLAGMLDRFRYLKWSLILLLSFVGLKMILSHHYEISSWMSLAVIAVILTVGVAASLILTDEKRRPGSPPASEN